MIATEILETEHQVILQTLAVLERLAGRAAAGQLADQGTAADDLLDFLRNFADACHHGKEEGILFARMEARGLPRQAGPLAVMLHEHTIGRSLIERMGVSLKAREDAGFAKAAEEYVRLMRDHIGKENNVLYPMANEMMNDADQAAMLADFEAFEHNRPGGRSHNEYLALAMDLAARYEVDREAARQALHAHGGCGCAHHAPKAV